MSQRFIQPFEGVTLQLRLDPAIAASDCTILENGRIKKWSSNLDSFQCHLSIKICQPLFHRRRPGWRCLISQVPKKHARYRQ